MYTADLTISCVLYHTPESEISRMVEQVSKIPLKTYLMFIDNTPEKKASRQSLENVVTINTGINLGYGSAHNIAIRECRSMAPFHLIANTDIVFDGADLKKLTDLLLDNPDIGMVAPRVRYPDGQLQHLCRLLPHPVELIGRRFFGRTKWGERCTYRYELRGWDYCEQKDIPSLSGCFMLTRHALLTAIDGFDERFFLYFEDTDLSRRINAISRTVFSPIFEITHLYRSKSRPSPTLLGHLMRNGFRYFSKWGWFDDPHRAAVNRATLASVQMDGADLARFPER